MLENKRIIITGAGGALGSAAVKAVEEAGGAPILFDKTFKADDGQRPQYELDLTDAEAVRAVVDRVGPFHGVLNIAGGFAMGDQTDSLEGDQWDLMQALNVATVRSMVAAVMPKLRAQGDGAIVNVGAYAALSAASGMGAYIASKATVMKLTEQLAEEARADGVRVNAILPTILDTPGNRAAMPDANHGEWVSIDRLAQVMVFLLSDSARDMHGALIPIRGLS